MTDYEEGKSERRAAKPSGALSILEDNPYDIAIATRFRAGNKPVLTRLHIHYTEQQLLSSFELDESAPEYQGNHSLFMAAAVKTLLIEVRSRKLAKHRFSVWYYTEQERDLLEQAAGRFTAQQPEFQRYLDEMVLKTRIIYLADRNK